MQSVKMLDDVVDVARRAADRWYVTVGHAAVGPVNLDLLARGVEAGKVPIDAFVRHEQWKVWRPLSELAVFEDGDAHSPRPELTDDISEAGRTPLPIGGGDLSSDPGSRRDALLLLMTAAVSRGGADAAIVHEIDDDGAVAVCAHGSSRWEALGIRTPRLDPAVVAASTGATLVVVGGAPFTTGSPLGAPADRAGASVVSRLCRVAGPVEGAVLIPILADGCLLAMIEIGRRTSFQPAEIASLEALVASLADRLR
jgi:hypothetical protein